MGVHKLITEADKLLKQAAKPNRDKLTKEEIEDLRTDIAINRSRMVTEVLLPAANARSAADLAMNALEGKEFIRYFKGYSGKEYKDASGTTKKYTASVAESVARKALHAKGTPYYKAKEHYHDCKDFEGNMYQLLKSIDQVTNALSAVSKAS